MSLEVRKHKRTFPWGINLRMPCNVTFYRIDCQIEFPFFLKIFFFFIFIMVSLLAWKIFWSSLDKHPCSCDVHSMLDEQISLSRWGTLSTAAYGFGRHCQSWAWKGKTHGHTSHRLHTYKQIKGLHYLDCELYMQKRKKKLHCVNTSNTNIFMAFLLVRSFITCVAKESLHFYQSNWIQWTWRGNYTLVYLFRHSLLLVPHMFPSINASPIPNSSFHST